MPRHGQAPGGVRLQKVMAAAGVASRREAERLIQAGRVEVNGRVVTALGTRVDPATDDDHEDRDRAHQHGVGHDRARVAAAAPE